MSSPLVVFMGWLRHDMNLLSPGCAGLVEVYQRHLRASRHNGILFKASRHKGIVLKALRHNGIVFKA